MYYHILCLYEYRDKEDHPIARMRQYLVNRGMWDQEKEDQLKKDCRKKYST